MKKKFKFIDQNCVVRVRSAVEPFLIESVKTDATGEDAIRLHNDLSILLNQKRLDKMTADALQKWFDSTSALNSVDNLADIRKGLGDEQLVQFMKSRYIQSPSELQRYSSYLTALAIERQNEKLKSKE